MDGCGDGSFPILKIHNNNIKSIFPNRVVFYCAHTKYVLVEIRVIRIGSVSIRTEDVCVWVEPEMRPPSSVAA